MYFLSKCVLRTESSLVQDVDADEDDYYRGIVSANDLIFV